MADTGIRRATAADRPALQTLWETVFGDPPEFIQTFFAHFPPESSGWVVSREAEICSAAYLLTGNHLVWDGHVRPCAYVYAVATPAAQRGNGYASHLMRHFAQLADKHGFALYTRPAEPGLFAWYRAVMGASAIGMGCETSVQRDGQNAAPLLPIQPVEPEAYGHLREAHLSGTAHVALSNMFLALQDASCRTAGGALFKVGNGCCVVELSEDTLLVKELLIPSPQWNSAVQSLLHHFHRDTAIVRRLAQPEAQIPFAAYRTISPAPKTAIHWGLFLD